MATRIIAASTARSTAVIPTQVHLQLQTLGGLALERIDAEGQASVIRRGGKPLVLLAWLARREGRGQDKAAVARRFWPNADATTARKSLRQALHVLRGLVGTESFRDEGETVALRLGVVSVDLTRLHEAINRADVAQVFQLYRGTFLPRAESGAGDALVEWISTERTRLREGVLGLIRPLVETRVRTSDVAAAVALAQDLVRAESGVVGAVELLCDALVAAGRLAEAAAAVAQCDPGDGEDELQRLSALEQRLVKLRGSSGNGDGGSLARMTVGEAIPEAELVGRDGEISAVMQLLEEAHAGRRRRCLVTGRAGIGKSRLLDAIGVRARWRGARIVRVEFVPAMRDTPLSALRELLRVIGGLAGAVGIQPTSAARLVAMVPALAPRFSGVEPAEDVRAQVEGPRMLASLVEELLAAVSEDRLRVLLCDDVHYADAASLAVFATLPTRNDLPLLEIWAGRLPLEFPRETPVIELSTLGAQQIHQLLSRRARLPDAPWVDALVGELRDRTGGLPRLVAAQLRSLERSRALEMVAGEWTWQRGDPVSALRGMRSGVLGHEAGLSEPARTALRILATWHHPLSDAVLRRALVALQADAQPAAVERAIRELDTNGLVQSIADGWSVAHDAIADEVMHEETAESFLAVVRALLAAMAALQQLDASTVDSFALLCGSRDHLSAAVTVIGRASKVALLRRQGLYGRKLAQRIALSAARPEWERPLLRSVGWLRRLSPAGLLRLGGGAAASILVAGWTAMMLQPRLVLESAPMGELHASGPSRSDDVVELVVQPRLGVFNGFGRRLTGFDGAIRARAIRGGLYGDTIRAVEEGIVQFERLTIADVARVSEGDWRAAAPQLEFDAGPLVRSARIDVAGAWGAGPLRLIRSRRLSVNGIRLDSALTYDVPPLADSLRFDLTFEYSTPLATANYVVGAAGTWLPSEQVIRLAGLPRPVREAWRSVRFTLPVPRGDGPFHVIIAASPEESVAHLFSATNWAVGAPRWGDGNDLVDLPLWALDSLRRSGHFTHDGYLMTRYAGPESEIMVGPRTVARWRPSRGMGRGAGIAGLVVRIR